VTLNLSKGCPLIRMCMENKRARRPFHYFSNTL